MSVEAISAIAPVNLFAADAAGAALAPATAEVSSPFGAWFSKELGAVNDKLVGADLEIQKTALGDSQSLHQVMIHLEEAKLSFQLLAQVRNRLLEAYQEVMRMQV